jgi:hypothetical protein
MTHTTMTRSDRYRLAAESDLDVRTIEALLRGASVQTATRRVILDAAARIGLAHLIPTAPPPPPASQERATAASRATDGGAS